MDGKFALDAILTKAFFENNQALAKLQVEESGRTVASLQGHIAGYKELVKIISEEFIVSPGWCSVAQDNAQEDIVLPDMSDEAMAELNADAMNLIKNSESWGKVLSRVQDVTNRLKDQLFTNGHSTRDIDLAQGHYHDMTIYESFFKAIDNEIVRREGAKKEKEGELPFDSDGPAGDPGTPSMGTLRIEAPKEKVSDNEDDEEEVSGNGGLYEKMFEEA